jgi:hypothetical protein
MIAMRMTGGGSTAHLCLEDPKPERLKSAFEAGKMVRVQLAGCVDEMHLRDGHADLDLALHDVAVRPDGRKTISGLIEAKQKESVR